MNDPTSVLKSRAKNLRAIADDYPLRQYGRDFKLSHGQSIEVVCAAYTDTDDWNKYSSSPTPIRDPESVEELLKVVSKVFVRMKKLKTLSDMSFQDDEFIAQTLITWIDHLQKQLSLLDFKTLLSREIEMSPQTVDREGNMTPITELFELPDHEGMTKMVFGSWFHEWSSKNEIVVQYGDYLWDSNEKIAVELGVSEKDAALIRMLQRESYSHTWPIEFWIVTGLISHDQASFVEGLVSRDGWREYFTELYNTDCYTS